MGSERGRRSHGFLIVAIFGGLISSASTTAAATLVATHQITHPEIAGIATVLTSMSSALVNMPLVYQTTHQIALTRRLAIITTLIVLLGLGILAAQPFLGGQRF